MTKEKPMYWGCLFSNHEIRPIGWFDMSDWDAGSAEVLKKIAEWEKTLDAEAVHWIRADCIDDLIADLELMKQRMKERP
jgi:hypothetical protein